MVDRKVGVVLKSIHCFFFLWVYSFIFTNRVSTYFAFENETNIPFDLIKTLPFALTAKLCMWMPPFLSRN